MMPPQPIQLFSKDAANKIILNEEALEMFKKKNIKDKKVCIVSVAGPMRQGKSFLLNFFLDFFQKKMNFNDLDNWCRKGQTLPSGFPWETRVDKVTEGITVWPEIFLTEDEKVAIILMDTQGTFDHDTSMSQCTSLFALTTMLSSVLIYNVKNHLTLDKLTDLQINDTKALSAKDRTKSMPTWTHESFIIAFMTMKGNYLVNLNMLPLFVEYGKFSTNNTLNDKPFQNLLILIRDWCYSNDYSFGLEGGNNLLEYVYDSHDNSEKNELKSIKDSICENFEEVNCFLLPFPGEDVTTNRGFQGSFDDINEEFLENMKTLIAFVLSPHHLATKNLNGQEIKVNDLPKLIQTYWESFKSGAPLEVESMYTALCKAFYECQLNEFLSDFKTLIKSCLYVDQAKDLKKKTLTKFRARKRMEQQGLKDQFELQLAQELDEVIADYKVQLRVWEIIRSLVLVSLIQSIIVLHVCKSFLTQYLAK